MNKTKEIKDLAQANNFLARVEEVKFFFDQIFGILTSSFSKHLYGSPKFDSINFCFEKIQINGKSLAEVIDDVEKGSMDIKEFFIKLDVEIMRLKNRLRCEIREVAKKT